MRLTASAAAVTTRPLDARRGRWARYPHAGVASPEACLAKQARCASSPRRHRDRLDGDASRGRIGLPGQPPDERRGGFPASQPDALARPQREKLPPALLRGGGPRRACQRILKRVGENRLAAALDLRDETVDDPPRRSSRESACQPRLILAGGEDRRF